MSRMPPFVRGLLIIAAIALVIMALNLYVALATVAVLLRVAFFIAMAVAAYFFWRDFARREIDQWPSRAQWVVYGAVAVFVIDLAWFFFAPRSGRDALAFFLVAGACVYAAFRTWKLQTTYGA